LEYGQFCLLLLKKTGGHKRNGQLDEEGFYTARRSPMAAQPRLDEVA